MKRYFTSDWHLGEDRLGGSNGKPNVFYRPFKDVFDNDASIIAKFCKSGFTDGDELWHLGDVLVNANSVNLLDTLKTTYPNSGFNLLVGNYDEDKIDVLKPYFDKIVVSTQLNIGGNLVYLNHYPTKCKSALQNGAFDFALTGHIHSLWKVQHRMINVGVDAWNYEPVSEDTILFCWNAMQKYYDEDVFPYK